MPHEYDIELGKITDQDREYAADLICDYCCALSGGDTDAYAQEQVAQWLRKVRYEAVIADRAKR